MVVISPHTMKRMLQRDISKEDTINTISNGEEAYETEEGRYGSKLDFDYRYLVVVWEYEKDDKIVITAYWKSKKTPKYRFIN